MILIRLCSRETSQHCWTNYETPMQTHTYTQTSERINYEQYTIACGIFMHAVKRCGTAVYFLYEYPTGETDAVISYWPVPIATSRTHTQRTSEDYDMILLPVIRLYLGHSLINKPHLRPSLTAYCQYNYNHQSEKCVWWWAARSVLDQTG